MSVLDAMLLQVENLHVRIDVHEVCRDLSFNLAAGRSLAVLGRNGAGKSTLLAALAGLHAADTGQIRLHGKTLAAYAPRALAQIRAWAPQQAHDAFATSVIETALIGRHPYISRWAAEDSADRLLALQALQRVGLQEMAARQVQTLSGGERQRLTLAMLLVQAPQCYFLDEPLSHLDLNHAMQALALLGEEQRKGRSVVAVLHEPNLARRHFDAALLLFGDGSWLYGASAEVITAENLQRLYGHPLRELTDGQHPWFIPE